MSLKEELKEEFNKDPINGIKLFLGDYSFFVEKLCDKIDELQKEIEDIKYRYVMRTDLED